MVLIVIINSWRSTVVQVAAVVVAGRGAKVSGVSGRVVARTRKVLPNSCSGVVVGGGRGLVRWVVVLRVLQRAVAAADSISLIRG